jgi:hypothetical protein
MDQVLNVISNINNFLDEYGGKIFVHFNTFVILHFIDL